MRVNRSPPPHNKPGRGNALFLILIAVALFAALSYAVTQSGRGSGDVDKEQSLILGSQITQEGAALRQTVTRMILTGTVPNDLDFFSNATGTDAVFAPEGGGLNLPTLPEGAKGNASARWIYEPANSAANAPGAIEWRVETLGSDAWPDGTEIIVVGAFLGRGVCEAINRGLGESVPVPTIGGGCFASLSLGNEASIWQLGATDCACAGCVGEPFLCIKNVAAETYSYYHVLVER